eukprot:PhF_6_TR32952/c0_g1_i1/m.48485/K00920/PIP4K2; 1-phosphatidylinositol-5-phosphate 4-kinase
MNTFGVPLSEASPELSTLATTLRVGILLSLDSTASTPTNPKKNKSEYTLPKTTIGVAPGAPAGLQGDVCFVDYTPLWFRELRSIRYTAEQLSSFRCDVDAIDTWRVSATGAGKSDAKFFCIGGTYIAKTMKLEEWSYWKKSKLRDDYYARMKDESSSKQSFLPEYLGFFGMKWRHSEYTARVVVFRNIMWSSPEPVRLRYDLKGSSAGRSAFDGRPGSPNNLSVTTNSFSSSGDTTMVVALLKDNDVPPGSVLLHFPPELITALTDTITADVEFLNSHGLVDYSLYVGIRKCNPEEEAVPHIPPTQYSSLPEHKEVYYLGIIDILQPYNTKKKLENGTRGVLSKLFSGSKAEISSVPPADYAKRFVTMVRSILGNV